MARDHGLRVALHAMNTDVDEGHRKPLASEQAAESIQLIGGPGAGMRIPADSEHLSKNGLAVWIPTSNGDARYTRPGTDDTVMVFDEIDDYGREQDQFSGSPNQAAEEELAFADLQEND